VERDWQGGWDRVERWLCFVSMVGDLVVSLVVDPVVSLVVDPVVSLVVDPVVSLVVDPVVSLVVDPVVSFVVSHHPFPGQNPSALLMRRKVYL
jgi:hypothetical protein